MPSMLPQLDMDALAVLTLPATRLESDAEAFNPSPSTPDHGSLGKHSAAVSPPQLPTQGPRPAKAKKNAKAFSPSPKIPDRGFTPAQGSPGKHVGVVSPPWSPTQGPRAAKVESDAETFNPFTPDQGSLSKHAAAVSPRRSPTQGPRGAKLESYAEAFNSFSSTPDQGSLGKHAPVVSPLPQSPMKGPPAAKVKSNSEAFRPSATTLRKHTLAMSPPRSPVQGPRDIATPAAPKEKKQPLLMHVLELAMQGLHNLDKVRAVLALDPDAVLVDFWGDDMEPPLCCAVRCGCSATVIELLLEHGACAADVNCSGQSPLDVLKSSRPLPELGPGAAGAGQNIVCPVEKLLLEAGAKPQPPSDGNVDERRRSGEKLFLEAGARPHAPNEGNLGWGSFEGNLGWEHFGMQPLAWPVWPTAPVLVDGLEAGVGASQKMRQD